MTGAICIETRFRKVSLRPNEPFNVAGNYGDLRRIAKAILEAVGDVDIYGWIQIPIKESYSYEDLERRGSKG